MKLEKQCGVCGSYVWCGRQCGSAPARSGRIDRGKAKPAIEERIVPKMEEPAPWDDDYIAAPKYPAVLKTKRKAPDSIRFPEEVKAFFKKGGPGWQKRINEVLLDHVRRAGQ